MTSVIKITRFGSYGIVISDGKLLLTQKMNGPYRGLWDLPGGGIEFSESPEEALKREIKEETATAASDLKLFCCLTSNGSYQSGKESISFHHIGMIYKIGSIKPIDGLIPEEEMRWEEPVNLSENELTPFAREVIFRLSQDNNARTKS